MTLSQDDVLKILKLMDQSEYENLHLEIGDLKIVVNKSANGRFSQETSAKPASTGGNLHANKDLSVTSEESNDVSPISSSKTVVDNQSGGDEDAVAEKGLVAVRSPILGTFYRSPGPDQPPFVEVGQFVEKEATVCIIEVMKLYSTVEAGTQGRIVKICAENEQMVEYNQILFLIEPENEA